ncbi:unnamed protein product [Amoebophrya sp. A25]|nr:unnamed protein product [Amoebophrya sp. A25]|eukprot:GSA25T00003064001.1
MSTSSSSAQKQDEMSSSTASAQKNYEMSTPEARCATPSTAAPGTCEKMLDIRSASDENEVDGVFAPPSRVVVDADVDEKEEEKKKENMKMEAASTRKDSDHSLNIMPMETSSSGTKIKEQTPQEELQDRICRFCFDEQDDNGNTELISPCLCSGGQKWIHLSCLRRWQRTVLVTQPTHPAFYDRDIRHMRCNVCKSEFTCAPPSRHDLMQSFTGGEIAALIQQKSIIVSHESFNAELERELARLPPFLRPMCGHEHWVRAVMLITKVEEPERTIDMTLHTCAEVLAFFRHLYSADGTELFPRPPMVPGAYLLQDSDSSDSSSDEELASAILGEPENDDDGDASESQANAIDDEGLLRSCDDDRLSDIEEEGSGESKKSDKKTAQNIKVDSSDEAGSEPKRHRTDSTTEAGRDVDVLAKSDVGPAWKEFLVDFEDSDEAGSPDSDKKMEGPKENKVESTSNKKKNDHMKDDKKKKNTTKQDDETKNPKTSTATAASAKKPKDNENKLKDNEDIKKTPLVLPQRATRGKAVFVKRHGPSFKHKFASVNGVAVELLDLEEIHKLATAKTLFEDADESASKKKSKSKMKGATPAKKLEKVDVAKGYDDPMGVKDDVEQQKDLATTGSCSSAKQVVTSSSATSTLAASSSCLAAESSCQLPESATKKPSPPSSTPRRTLKEFKITLEVSDEVTCGEDHVVAVNLSRRIEGPRSAAKLQAQLAKCEIPVRRTQLGVEIEHYIGGPCDERDIMCAITLGGSGDGWTAFCGKNCLSEAVDMAYARWRMSGPATTPLIGAPGSSTAGASSSSSSSSSSGASTGGAGNDSSTRTQMMTSTTSFDGDQNHIFGGQIVRLVRLKACPELNGEFGIALRFHGPTGRWLVRLANGEGKQLKPVNLEAVEPREINTTGGGGKIGKDERKDEEVGTKMDVDEDGRDDDVDKKVEEVKAKNDDSKGTTDRTVGAEREKPNKEENTTQEGKTDKATTSTSSKQEEKTVTTPAPSSTSTSPPVPKKARVLCIWGDARWSRTQLLGEVARGSWGLCHANVSEFTTRASSRWDNTQGRLVFAPLTEMSEDYMRNAERDMALARVRRQMHLTSHAEDQSDAETGGGESRIQLFQL